MDTEIKLLEALSKMKHESNIKSAANIDLMDLEFFDENDNNALHVAAANGHEDIVELLLDRGIPVNSVNTYGWTALMQAARNGHTDVVNVLLARGADIMAKNRIGTTALECAARSGHLSTVEVLGEAGSFTQSGSELTPLMVASQSQHNSIVRLLLDEGADVNQRFPGTGTTALMIASATNDNDSTARLLVESGADVSATNVIGQNAMDISVERGNIQVRSFLEQTMALCKPSDTELHESTLLEAIRQYDVKRVSSMIAANRELVDCSDKSDGQTPLIRAVVGGSMDMVSLVLDSGAAIDRIDKYGFTPLMQAIFCGHNEIALYLMGAGANVNHYDPEKCRFTPFDIATFLGHPNKEVIKGLTEMMGFSHSCKKKADKELKKNRWLETSTLFKKKSPRTNNCELKPTGKVVPSTDPLLSLVSGSPCDGYLLVDHLPTIVSPLLPSCGLNYNNSGRYDEPPGQRKLPNGSGADKSRSMATLALLKDLSLTESSHKRQEDDITNSTTSKDTRELYNNDALYRHLVDMSLKQYYNLFSESEIDIDAFRLLTDSDLLEMGMNEQSSRNLILNAVTILNNS